MSSTNKNDAATCIEKLSKEGSNGYAIVHSQDLDGITSAAFLVHYFNMQAKHVFFGKPGKRIEEVIKKMKGNMPKKSVIVVADLAYNPSVHAQMESFVKEMKNRGNYVAWIDHHPIDAKGRKALQQCDFLMVREYKSCAAELIYKKLVKPAHGPDDYGENMCTIAHISDFNIKNTKYDGLIRIISGAISFLSGKNDLYGLRKITDTISKGELKNAFIERNYRNYVTEAKKSKIYLVKSIKMYVFGGKKIGIGFGKNVSSNEACAAIEKKTSCDVSAYVNIRENTLHLRGNGTECLKIAKYFGGNGHPYASGADITGINLNSTSGKKEFLKELESAAEQAYTS
ncbi:MAG: DHH family phosphoesterase [Candidatus Micrarchaeia archaeon]